jgi:hypothetical protein
MWIILHGRLFFKSHELRCLGADGKASSYAAVRAKEAVESGSGNRAFRLFFL